MRRVTGSAALLALALLGGCASAPPPGAGGALATRAPAVPCSTTWLVLATLSKCGSGGLKFGVAAE